MLESGLTAFEVQLHPDSVFRFYFQKFPNFSIDCHDLSFGKTKRRSWFFSEFIRIKILQWKSFRRDEHQGFFYLWRFTRRGF